MLGGPSHTLAVVADLPSFRNPPVDEVVLGVQFAPLEGLLSPHFGLFWQESLRSDFPKVEEKPALEPQLEQLNELPRSPQPGLRLLEKMETARVWFLSETGNELVQLQPDRFHMNWRRREKADKYPRYPYLRKRFEETARKLVAFLEREELGAFAPVQVEMTYVNAIKVENSEAFAAMEDFFSVWTKPVEIPGVSLEMSHFGLTARIVDGKETIGRLRVTAAPATSTLHGPNFKMDLTARGLPLGSGSDGVMAFLDRAHSVIVQTFDSITTKGKHEMWGKS